MIDSQLQAAWLTSFAPPPKTNIVEWCKSNIVLPASNAEPGPLSLVSYQKGLVEAFADPDTETLVYMLASSDGEKFGARFSATLDDPERSRTEPTCASFGGKSSRFLQESARPAYHFNRRRPRTHWTRRTNKRRLKYTSQGLPCGLNLNRIKLQSRRPRGALHSLSFSRRNRSIRPQRGKRRRSRSTRNQANAHFCEPQDRHCKHADRKELQPHRGVVCARNSRAFFRAMSRVWHIRLSAIRRPEVDASPPRNCEARLLSLRSSYVRT